MLNETPIISLQDKKAIVKRLHYIKGQIGGIEKMLGNHRSVKDVYVQLRAVEKALHETIYVVLDEQLKKHFAEVLVERLEQCPGDCKDCDHLEFLKHEFSKLDLKELIDQLMWLHNSSDNNSQRPSTKRR
jgi:DNA-binding FrmR family transcriptional regulator